MWISAVFLFIMLIKIKLYNLLIDFQIVTFLTITHLNI